VNPASPKVSEAERQFQEALRTAQQGHVPEGIVLMRKVVRDHPDHADAWGHLGFLLYMSKQPEEAVRCYQEVRRLTPDNTEAVERLGDCYQILGDRKKARETYLSLRGTPAFETDRLQQRLAMVQPVWRRLVQRGGPLAAQFLRRVGEPAFLHALGREFVLLPRSLPGIRAVGLSGYLGYLNQHYLKDRGYRFPLAPCDLCGGTRFRAVFFYKSQKKVKCSRCGLECVERKPPESLDVLVDWYNLDSSIEYMERNWHNETFFELRISMLRKIFEESGMPFPSRGDRVFEIGCAEGHVLKYLSEQGAEAEGIETAQKLVDYCRQKSGLNVTRSTIRGFEPPEEKFTHLFSYHVLEHLEKPSELFVKARKMLRSGGFLFIEVPTTDLTKHSLTEQLDETHGYGNMGHLHYFQPETLSQYFPKYGFELLNTYEYVVEALASGGFLAKKV